MARVPTYQGGGVALQPLPSQRYRAADNGGGVAGAIAQGLQELGKGIGDVAKATQLVAVDRAEDEAKKAESTLALDLSEGLDNPESGLRVRRGQAAADAFEPTMSAMEKRRKEIASGLSPMAQKMFGQAADERMLAFRSLASRHIAVESEKARDETSTDRLTIQSDGAINNADDPDVQHAFIATGLTELSEVAKRKGWSAENYTAARTRYLTGIHTGVVDGYIDRGQLDKAIGYLDTHKDEIGWKEENALRNRMRAPLEARETATDVAGIWGSAAPGSRAIANYSDPLRGVGRSPVAGGKYGASRDYGSHHGVDIPAPKGTSIYSTAPGTAKVSRSPKGGNIVTVDHHDGTVSRYMHLGDVNVRDGAQVGPDTIIGTVGMTGRSTGPHLHWEVLKNGKPVDPDTILGTGQQGQGPQRRDLNGLLAATRARAKAEGWSFERTERAEDKLRQMVREEDDLVHRGEEQAKREALDIIDRLPDNRLTSIEQIPSKLRARLSTDDRMSLEDMARRNSQPEPVRADGDTALTLNLMAINEPERFQGTDLRMYRGRMTPGEFASLATLQAKARANPNSPEALDHSRVWGVINRHAPDLNLDLGTTGGKARTPKDRETSMRIFSMMQRDLMAVTGGKRQPTDDEIKRAFDSATLSVTTYRPGWLYGETPVQTRRYDVAPGQRMGLAMPNGVRERIIASVRRTQRGRTPSDDEIGQIYLNHRGQPGFWQ
ncbi:M23 family metallopeptidase [Sphingomonas sp. J344]|nr:M23 family metallopeptidase [Sphingomonas sp. J344]MCR5872257.1 M23 family metallopeptidase [Sphingomonas sp. J344]